MVINTNTSAISSARLLSESSALLAKSLSRLSSGSKIVNPEDDAGGLAVSLKFDAQINRNNAAKSNVLNALSFNQTRDGYLQKVQKALDRMSELAVLAQDVTKTEDDRALYDKEFQELVDFIEETAQKDFNGISLFTNTDLAITSDSDAKTFDLKGINLSATQYDFSSVGVSTSAAAVNALTAVKAAIDQLATDRATVAAGNAHLTYVADRLSILNDNLVASNSRIKDVDVAEESTKFARYNILVQAGTAMLAQANASPQSALRLLS
ncbi:flagellin [Fontisphaera persica]|uniref:flagellin n=1 Tax=Fontisphaera persica TaxID=2974023 RepID=UPI0024C08721|nr:flagellin [Fontisphaera persica]WCJ58177.1 flagellin [Fontisphaera persica]